MLIKFIINGVWRAQRVNLNKVQHTCLAFKFKYSKQEHQSCGVDAKEEVEEEEDHVSRGGVIEQPHQQVHHGDCRPTGGQRVNWYITLY